MKNKMYQINMIEYVTKPEFNTSMAKIDKKFEESTETMVKQFDRMYVYMNDKFAAVDRRFDAVDRRFDAMDLRLNRIDANLSMLNSNMEMIAIHLGGIERHLGIKNELLIKQELTS